MAKKSRNKKLLGADKFSDAAGSAKSDAGWWRRRAQPALQAVLETPHDCRLSNFHPSVQDFVALRLPRYRTVRWNQNGSEPRLVFVKDGLITGILYLEANADNLEDVLQAHGIFPSR